MKPYLLVSGDFVRTGGMDRANYALAAHLADIGHPVHLVAHRADPDLLARPGVEFHPAPKLIGSYFLSGPLLSRSGRRWASRLASAGTRVVVNGGNCAANGVNWVHYVHAAFTPPRRNGLFRQLLANWKHRIFLRQERTALKRARLVLANSERTRRDLVERLDVPVERIHTVYLAADPQHFYPPTPAERSAARKALGLADDRLCATFIGAPGDRRKGFDIVLAAWRRLAAQPNWNVDLVVVGAGTDQPSWHKRIEEQGLASFVRLLKPRGNIHELFWACDVMVAPTRYEAYGLAVHEALCCGLPTFVSQSAGVAERYLSAAQTFLLPDPEDDGDLAERMRQWRQSTADARLVFLRQSAALREHTWEDTVKRIVVLIEQHYS